MKTKKGNNKCFLDIDTLVSNRNATVSDFKNALYSCTSSLTRDCASKAIDPCAQLITRWANTLISMIPLQSTPTSSTGLATNELIESEYTDFINVVGQYVFTTYELLEGELSWNPIEIDRTTNDNFEQYRQELFDKFCQFSSTVHSWVYDGQISDNGFQYDSVWLFSYYLRLSRVLLQELTCRIDLLDFNELLLFVRHILPNASSSRPLALASSLTYLHECLICSELAHQIVNGNLKVASEWMTDQLSKASAKASFSEAELWQKVGRFDYAAESMAALAWIGFVTGGSDPVHETVLNYGRRSIDYMNFDLMGDDCPLLLLETTRRIWLSGSSDWLEEESIDPGTVLSRAVKALGGALIDPTRISAQRPYRVVVRAELLVRPPSDVLVGVLMRERDLGSAALELVVHGTRPDHPERSFPSNEFFSSEQWKDSREQLEEARLALFNVQKKIPAMHNELIQENKMAYNKAREKLLALLVSGAQSYGKTIINLDDYRKQCHARFVLLEQHAKEFKVDLLFIGMADEGYCCIHYDPNRPKIFGVHFYPEETRGRFMGCLTQAFAENDDELTLSMADFLANNICNSLDLGSRVCLIPIGELTSLPLSGSFAVEIQKRNKSVGAFAQLSDNYFSIRHQNYIDREFGSIEFIGYANTNDLSAPAFEFNWTKQGFKGKVKENFTRIDVLEALCQENRIVHIATHGVFDNTSPMLSGWVTNNGLLTGLDMLNKRFNTILLMVNTCTGARGGVFAASSGFGPLQIALSNGVQAALAPTSLVGDEIAKKIALMFQECLGNGHPLADSFSMMIHQSQKNEIEEIDWRYYILWGNSIPRLFGPFLKKKC